jgi:uncharacterized membrane protein
MIAGSADDKTRAVMRWILATFYSAAGVAHLLVPDKLLAITPPWVPFAPQVILITGWCELLGAIALVTKPHLVALYFAGVIDWPWRRH